MLSGPKMSMGYAPFGEISEPVYVIFFLLDSADILWILIFTRQHGLTRFTCFHGQGVNVVECTQT